MRLNWMEERRMKKNTKAARRMVRIAGAMTVIASAMSVPLMASAPAQAYAGTPGCATLREYRSVSVDANRDGGGMTQLQVARRFGTYAHPYWGWSTYKHEYGDGDTEIDREYRRCNRLGKPVSTWNGDVEVDFQNQEFESDYDWWYGGALRSTYKYYSAY